MNKPFLFLALLFCVCTGTLHAQQKLRVLTYNIHHANPPSEDKSVIRLDSIAAIISNAKADIVALQELDSNAARSGKTYQLKELADMLGMHYYFSKAIPYDGGSYGVGILSKYKITDASSTPLPKTPGLNSESRIFSLVKIHLPGNKYIWFGCTHLDVTNEATRTLQAEKIITLVKDKTPVIIGGDFNAENESTTINKLQTFFTNASKAQAPTLPNINPTKKIDFIFYAPAGRFELVKEKVMTEATYASDHLPFCVELSVK